MRLNVRFWLKNDVVNTTPNMLDVIKAAMIIKDVMKPAQRKNPDDCKHNPFIESLHVQRFIGISTTGE
jgi:hypothetical protein